MLFELFQARFVFLNAALISATALVVALGAQYFYNIQPCELCVWQRWPYAAALLLSLAGFFVMLAYRRALLLLLALAFAAGAGLAFFHVGVEQHWWQGLAGCVGNISAAENATQLLNEIMGQMNIIRCDEVNWAFAGISMTVWNTALSVVLCLYALASWGRYDNR